MKKISFVIPCYCSEKMISGVLDRIEKTVENDGRYDYEIVCVNDASKDNTYKVLKDYASQDDKVKVLNFSKNFGQHAALMAGFKYASGDYIMCLDDDGQTPPEKLGLLMDKLEEGYDLVSAKYPKDDRGLVRKLGSRVSFAMSEHLVGMPKGIELNSYYVFRKYIRDEIIKYDNPYPFVHGLILQVTKNIANVELPREEREEGTSGYTFKSLVKLLLNGFTAFSEKPLRIVTMMGMLFSILGFISVIVVIIKRLVTPAMPAGYASMMSVLLFVGGIIMICIGMLGEYVSRIYICMNNIPQYVVKETCNTDKE